jgi:hypothetical protein
MFVNDIATMTVVKMKQVSTSTYTKVARGMKSISKIKFIDRNRRKVALCFAIWLVVNIAGYLVYHFAVEQTMEGFYQRGLTGARELATKSGPFVLENDILSLSVAIKELQDVKDLKFAAILNHQNEVVAHTDTEMLNRKFEPLKNEKPIDVIDGISIITGSLSKKEKAFGFVKDIVFSNVDIGKVYMALSAKRLDTELNRLRNLYLAGVALAIVLLGAVIFWLDRIAKAKALKISQDIERMDRIGPYLLQKKIARGGMAELFLADYIRQDSFKRTVAIKRILPHLASNPDFIKMFTREARVAALLQHPNIVQIFDYGQIENAYFIAMEYIDGKNMEEIISTMKQGLRIEQTVFIISQICKGLDYSHTKRDDRTGEPFNIVHRDISPQNMLISYQGEVKISDFGISKARSEPSLTQAGVVKGKLAYLSPEQAMGEAIDHRADIYALGLVFYEALTGKRVYKFSSDVEAIRTIPHMEIEPLQKALPQISEELDRIVMRCLEKKKAERYQRVSDLYTDLVVFKKNLKLTYDTSDLVNFMKKKFKPIPQSESEN